MYSFVPDFRKFPRQILVALTIRPVALIGEFRKFVECFLRLFISFRTILPPSISALGRGLRETKPTQSIRTISEPPGFYLLFADPEDKSIITSDQLFNSRLDFRRSLIKKNNHE